MQPHHSLESSIHQTDDGATTFWSDWSIGGRQLNLATPQDHEEGQGGGTEEIMVSPVVELGGQLRDLDLSSGLETRFQVIKGRLVAKQEPAPDRDSARGTSW